MRSLYIHIPFCRTKCRYCAFYSLPGTPRPLAEWLEPIPDYPYEAIYIGGGTPSLLGPDGIAQLCHAIHSQTDTSHVREWTFEANPESLTPATADAMLAGGATRLSLGAQSLNDDILRWLGRPHDAAAIRHAIHTARTAGFSSIGLDLITGIPTCTPTLWRETLHEALTLGCDHLSVYALTVEDHTPLAHDVATGCIQMPDDDSVLDSLAVAESLLSQAGFLRYEVSNYALPGHECLYNLSVWRGEDYLGLGPSASSRIGLTRRTNGPIGVPPTLETLSHHDDRRERFLTGLRIHEGANPSRWLLPDEAARALTTLHRLHTQGFVEPAASSTHWHLTQRGLEVADSVALELL